ncbi:hypothetical protein [Mucisphaera sp.]|uniref:hypothetical protein n=1 Tax=Mucisphaera sp. TaxID=2913024 RepID=UPI003D0ABD41
MPRWIRGSFAAILLAAGLAVATGVAQTDPQPANAQSDSVPASTVVERMLERREASPRIAPTGRNDNENASPVAMPLTAVDIDRSVLGLAPGEAAPPLMRDGSFIIGRRGHLRRSSDAAHLLFVFEAQAADNPTLPMIVQPCALREDMEDYLAERGNEISFIVSGQVFTYRGANYLLPTMMKIAIDRPGAGQ